MYAPPYYDPSVYANTENADYQYSNMGDASTPPPYVIQYPYQMGYEIGTGEVQVDYNAQTETPEQQAERERKEMEKNKRLELWGNTKTMNLDNILHHNILASPYFKGLNKLKMFFQVVDEIYNEVESVEPWLAGSAKIPSTAFCLLYKLHLLGLTVKQAQILISHSDSPYIRAIGFIYLRYACVPKDLWNWFSPYLEDEETIKPKGDKSKETTIGKFVRELLTEQRYFETILPRIPVPVFKEIEKKLKEHDEEVKEKKKKEKEKEKEENQKQETTTDSTSKVNKEETNNVSQDKIKSKEKPKERNKSKDSHRKHRSRSRSRSRGRKSRSRSRSRSHGRRSRSRSRGRRSRSRSKERRDKSSHHHSNKRDRSRDRSRERSRHSKSRSPKRSKDERSNNSSSGGSASSNNKLAELKKLYGATTSVSLNPTKPESNNISSVETIVLGMKKRKN